MTQESRLAIVIDSRQAQPSAEDLARALDAVDAAGVRVTSSSQRAGRSTAEAGRAYGQTGREARSGADGVDRVNRSLAQTESSAAAAAASIRRHLIAAVGGLSAMRLIDMADEWGQMASRIRMATQSADEYERVQARMLKSANDTYRNINETREAFVQLSPVLRQMGMSLDQSLDAIDTFSGLLVTNAASADRGANAMRALSIAFQKGKLDADQWISIYSTVDSIVDLIAQSSGKAAEEIRKLGASGKLSVEMLSQALVDGYLPTMEKVAEMPTTVRDAMQKVANEFTNYLGQANEVNGVTATMADGIAYLGENLGGVLNAGLVVGSSALAVLTSRMIGSTAATAAGTLAKRAAAAQELDLARAQQVQAAASMAQVRALGTITANMAQQTAAAAALERANQRLAAAQAGFGNAGRALLGVLGGPVGLVATVGLTAAAFVAMDGASDRAKLSMDKLTGSANEAAAAFAKLGSLSRQAALDSLAALQAEQARAASKAWHKFVNDLEPTAARGARAVAQMRSDMQAELQGITSDTKLSSSEIESAVDGLIGKWAEEGRVTAGQAQAYRALAAEASDLQGVANQTGQRISELSAVAARLAAESRNTAGAVQALNAAMAGFSGATGDYLARMQERTAAMQDGNSATKQAERYLAGLTDVSDAYRAAVMSQAHAQDAIRVAQEKANQTTKAAATAMRSMLEAALPAQAALKQLHERLALLQTAQKSGAVTAHQYDHALLSLNSTYTKAYQDALPAHIKALDSQLDKIREQETELRRTIRTFGMADSAATRLAAAETRAARAKVEATRATEVANGASAERIAVLDEEIERLGRMADGYERIAELQGENERLEAIKKNNEDILNEWRRVTEQIEQSLTDAIFEGGKSGKDLLRDLFKNMVLRVLVQPIVGSMMGALGEALGIQGAGGQSGILGGGGGGLGSILSMGSNISSVYSSLSGGLNAASQVGNLAWHAGANMGSSAMLNFAQGLQSTASMSAFKGAMSSGSMSQIGGAVLGSLGNAFAGYGISKGLSGGYSAGSWVDITAAVASAIPGVGPIAGAVGALVNRAFGRKAREVTAEGIQGLISATGWSDAREYEAWKEQGGWLVSSKRGTNYTERPDLASDLSGAVMAAFDQMEAYADLFGMGGRDRSPYNYEFKVPAGEQMMEQLQQQLTGFINSTARSLYSEVQEFARVGEEAGDTLVRLGDSLAATGSIFDMLGHQAYQSTLAQADMASHLIDVFGGVEAMATAAGGYYERYYSEQERVDEYARRLTGTFAGLGFALPESTQQLRAWIEAQDLSTERGRWAYANLMQLSGAFADLSDASRALSEAAAEQARAEAERVAGIRRAYLDIADPAGQFGRQVEALREQFAALGVAMPATLDAYAALVDRSGDLATELMVLAPAMSELVAASRAVRQSIMDATIGAWTDTERRAQSALAGLTRSVDAERNILRAALSGQSDAIRAQMDASRDLAATLSRAAGVLRGALDGILGSSVVDEAMASAQARARVSQAATVSRLTGVLPELTPDLERALGVVSQPAEHLYASFEEYQRDYLRTAHDINDLAGLADQQLTAEQQMLEQMQSQLDASQQWHDAEMSRLDAIIADAQERLAIANGTYQAVLSIPEALARFGDAITALANQSAGGAGYFANNPDVARYWTNNDTGLSAGEFAERHYAQYGAAEGRNATGMDLSRGAQYLARYPDLAAYVAASGLGGSSLDEWARAHYEQYGRWEGRSYATGTPYVPSDGLAYIHQGERIIPAKDNRELMRMMGDQNGPAAGGAASGDMAREVRALRVMSERQLYAIAKFALQTLRIIERWDVDGTPAERTDEAYA